MFERTDTVECPWTVVKSDDKKRARLNAIRYVLNTIPYEGRDDKMVGPVDPLIVGRATAMTEAAKSLRALKSLRERQIRLMMAHQGLDPEAGKKASKRFSKKKPGGKDTPKEKAAEAPVEPAPEPTEKPSDKA